MYDSDGAEFIWQEGSLLDYTNWSTGYLGDIPTDTCQTRKAHSATWSTFDCLLRRSGNENAFESFFVVTPWLHILYLSVLNHVIYLNRSCVHMSETRPFKYG